MIAMTKLLLVSFALAAVTISTAASAHQSGGGMSGQGMMRQDQGREPMAMQRGRGHMPYRHGMMRQGAMHGAGSGGHGMMGARYMGKGRHMGGAMGRGHMRVTPVQHLGIDDVSHFFRHRLERRGNDRLKLGAVKQKGEDTISAEIVTVDGSLVRTFEVDRHSGRVK